MKRLCCGIDLPGASGPATGGNCLEAEGLSGEEGV